MSYPKGSAVLADGNGRVFVLTPNTDGQVLRYDSSLPNGAEWIHGPRYFSAHDATGGLDINNGYAPIAWDYVEVINSNYSHTIGSPVIAFNETGTYKIHVDITTDIVSGNGRSQSQARITKDTGSGFLEIQGTDTYIYNRNVTQGAQTASINGHFNFNAGDQIQIEVQKVSGTSVLQTKAQSSRISIESFIQ